mgnify:FL=1
MSNRDKLIAQAEALETVRIGAKGGPNINMMGAAISCTAWVQQYGDDVAKTLRALAAQQEPVEEPVAWMIEITSAPTPLWFSGENTEEGDSIRPRFSRDANEGVRFSRKQDAESCLKFLLRARRTMLDVSNYAVTEHMWHNPQASAPADHTAADAPNREGGVANVEQCAAVDSAVGVTPDLDALVEDLMNMAINSKNYGRSNDGAYFEKAAQAITDLWAQLADKDAVQGTFESYAQIVAEHSANITRLEAENAELEKKAKNANADADIYAKAWQRELGRWMGNKRHHIDACVLGTQTLVADNAKARELLSMMLRWQEIGLSQFDLSEQSATGTRLAVVRAFLAKQGDTP